MIQRLPRLKSVSLVAILLCNTLQVVTFVEGKVFSFQNLTKRAPSSTCSSNFRELYLDFTVNFVVSTFLKIHLSPVPSPFATNLLFSKHYINCSTSLASHTKSPILHPSFHTHLLLFHSPTWHKLRSISSISEEIKNNLRNLCIKFLLPTHISSQNLISFPSTIKILLVSYIYIVYIFFIFSILVF